MQLETSQGPSVGAVEDIPRTVSGCSWRHHKDRQWVQLKTSQGPSVGAVEDIPRTVSGCSWRHPKDRQWVQLETSQGPSVGAVPRGGVSECPVYLSGLGYLHTQSSQLWCHDGRNTNTPSFCTADLCLCAWVVAP